MEWLDAGNGISEDVEESISKTLEWAKSHPDDLVRSMERDRREWPKKRRKAIKYVRRTRSKSMRIPDGLTVHDIERARRELESEMRQREARWAVLGRIANIAAIVGAAAAVATLIITIILEWFV